MALPYPTKVVLPFDIATAQDMNERHANDVALASGSGLDDGAVTPAKRSGGFAIGSLTLSSTGSLSVTGVGFTPKLVRFTYRPADSDSNTSSGSGAMTPTSQFSTWTTRSGTTDRQSRTSSTTTCIAAGGASSTTPTNEASYVSMDSDGFTINVTAAVGTNWSYEAYA